MLAGFRPRTPRSFCFGKRTQNHGRPGVALRGPLPRSRKVRAAELASLKQSSPPYQIRDRGAASPAGALGWRHGMARYNCKRQGERAALDVGPTTEGEKDRGSLEEGGMRCRHYD